MGNFARILNDVAVDVSNNPTAEFHPDVASQFESVPAKVRQGWVRVDGQWSAPTPTPQREAPSVTQVTPVEFMLLFTSAERVAIKSARPSDAVIDDFFDILEDPRMTIVNLTSQSTKDALAHFVDKKLVTQSRADEILSGKQV